tara:strand:+ start:3903 stop:6746 length:2844 start_codon:yes stop_codon:yes gene_type:complete
MPKKSIEINPFDGGLNNYADARDIKENELAAATNVITDQPGRIRVGKRIHSLSARTGPATISAGKGLFQYNSDYNATNSIASTEYQLMYHGNALFRRSTADTNFTSIASLGASYDPNYYALDGNIRLSDANLSSDTKFIGVTDVDNFGSDQSAALTIVNSYIDPPTDGDITIDPADSTAVPSNQNDNFLDLIVQKKIGSSSDWFTFNHNNTSDKTMYKIVNGATNTSNDVTESNFSSAADIASTHNLNGTNVNANEGHYYRVGKTDGSVSYSECKITFQTGQEVSFQDKSVFVDVYVPTATKNNLEATSFIVEIGNSESDHYTYNIASSSIEVDQWQTLEFPFGSHDEMDGSPNATGIKYFKITAKFQNAGATESNGNSVEWGVDNLKIGENSRGTWSGRYRFFYSWIYDKKQESIPFKFNGQTNYYEIENKILQFRAHMKLASSPGANDRITGANVYFVEYDLDDNPLDTDKKLLLEIDMVKGIKKTGAESFEAWGAAAGSGTGNEAPQNANHTNLLQIFDPPQLETFSTKAGYDEADKLKKIKYGSSVIMNRRSYVGNVKITDSSDKDIVHSDRVYKSEPNKPDLYTENGFIDVAINDGESITALASFGDMLLQFKERTMYLINCTQEIEYLEDTAKFRGVWGQGAVCETDMGIAWANKYGLFLFNGKNIISLIDKKLDPSYWNSKIGSKPIIGFQPLNRTILVVGDSDNASNGFTYSLLSESFNYLINDAGNGNLFTSDMTNLSSSNDGVLSWYQDIGTDITEYKWDAAIGDVYIDIKTRDQDFKDPARRKMVKNVYITYKSAITITGTIANGSQNVDVSSTANIVTGMTVTGTDVPAGTTVSSIADADTFVMSANATGSGSRTLTISKSIPVIKYLTNGGTTEYAFDAALQTNHSDWYTQVLKPNVSSEANNVYSFQVRIYGSSFEGFEINDINVIYRDKVLK